MPNLMKRTNFKVTVWLNLLLHIYAG